jgi:hypothetical protein
MHRLAAAALAVAALTQAAEARPGPARTSAAAEMAGRLSGLEERATACFAETILSNAAALRAARSGRWYEAAGVVGFLCRPEAGEVMRARDAMERRAGAGERYFRQVYVRRLADALSRRIGGAVAVTAVASAEPGEAAAR